MLIIDTRNKLLDFTYKTNEGILCTLNLLPVAAPLSSILTLATLSLALRRAATASQVACSRWQSTHDVP